MCLCDYQHFTSLSPSVLQWWCWMRNMMVNFKLLIFFDNQMCEDFLLQIPRVDLSKPKLKWIYPLLGFYPVVNVDFVWCYFCVWCFNRETLMTTRYDTLRPLMLMRVEYVTRGGVVFVWCLSVLVADTNIWWGCVYDGSVCVCGGVSTYDFWRSKLKARRRGILDADTRHKTRHCGIKKRNPTCIDIH